MSDRLDALMMQARVAIDAIREDLEPDGHWTPVLLVTDEDEDGTTIVHVGPLMSHGIDTFAMTSAVNLRKMRATAVVFVSIAYTATVDLDGKGLTREEVDALDKDEALVILGVDRNGDTAHVVQPIIRRDDATPLLDDPKDLGSGMPDGLVTRALGWGVQMFDPQEDDE